jgi:hypothetical protein
MILTKLGIQLVYEMFCILYVGYTVRKGLEHCIFKVDRHSTRSKLKYYPMYVIVNTMYDIAQMILTNIGIQLIYVKVGKLDLIKRNTLY